MIYEIVSRQLWHEIEGRVETLEQGTLPSCPEPLIVLGEPGMGKTELLRWLGCQPGYAFCTARQLINVRPDPRRLLGNAQKLVIDALDEVSARGEGDAVDLVLQKLGDLGYPSFVLSCRAADWRSATNASAINEQYSDRTPLALHLAPLSNDDIRHLLVSSMHGDVDKAEIVLGHYADSNLDGLLGNPQTLQMIARVAASGPLPNTKSELYTRATEILRKEHRNDKADLQTSHEAALNAAGAAFAALILTGSETIVTQIASIAEGEIAISEVATLPSAEEIGKVIGCRLFAPTGAISRFTYWHRSIGEYLGSRWLSQQADTALKRKRLLALFYSHGVVPASLRGMHAWLAYHNPMLASDVIAADPMGIIEYGETDLLDATQAKQLFLSLKHLSSDNPYFHRGWRKYAVKVLAQVSLLDTIRNSINDPATEHDFRLLLIETVNNSTIAEPMRPDLRRIGLSATDPLSHRLRALDALVALGGEDWPPIVAELHERHTEEENRLCIEIMQATGSTLYANQQIVGIALEYARHERSHVYAFTKLLDEIEINRLDGLLDELVRQVAVTGNRHDREGNNEINDLGYRLIERRLASAQVDAMRLWSWLRPFDEQYGYRRDSRERVHQYLREDDGLRRAIQRFILLDEASSKTVWERAWRLQSRSPGLRPTTDDICVLLSFLEKGDGRWRDLLNLIPHSAEEGSEAREMAKRLVSHRPDMLSWIDKLAFPPVQEWKVKHEEKERQRAAKKAMEWQKHRESYAPHVDAMRRGVAGPLIAPAEVYLGRYHEFDNKRAPLDRLNEWLGADIAAAALEGFEAFLLSDFPPSATEIAESHAESRRWQATAIINAGCAERIRCGKALAELSADRLTAAFYELQITFLGEPDKSHLMSAVDAEMQARGLKDAAVEAWIEPQLRQGQEHVDQLFQLMREPSSNQRATELAISWLGAYPDSRASAEAYLVDRLILCNKLDDLRAIAANRLLLLLNDDRRRLWDAAAFIADFEGHRDRLRAAGIADPSLLWAFRERVGGDHGRRISPILSVMQLAWLIAEFRLLYPVSPHPAGGWSGDRHPWDASEFLASLINRLAEISSEEAFVAFESLIAAPNDTYSNLLRARSAEQRRKLVESRYSPPQLDDLRAIVQQAPPRSPTDLQATVVGLLQQLQNRIHADPADSWRGFYRDDLMTPHDEERCRDFVLTMIGQYPESIDIQPEGHMAQDKRADIIAQFQGMRLPVEIKGQWHDALWHAADTQLDRLYTQDYAAERRGIYLVLWFGDQAAVSKRLRSQGRTATPPKTPQELHSRLSAQSKAAQEGRVEIIVLDCTRPPNA